MFMKIKLVSVLLAAALAAACVGIKVRPEQAPEFARAHPGWQTYRWQEPPLDPASATSANLAVVDAAVRSHAEQVLASLGYRLDPLAPQFELDYRIGDETAVGLAGYASPTDFTEGMFAGPNSEYEVNSRFYTHRTLGYQEISHLRLTCFDVATQRIVWAATASRLVDDPQASAQKIDRVIGHAVHKMLADFPAAAR